MTRKKTLQSPEKSASRQLSIIQHESVSRYRTRMCQKHLPEQSDARVEARLPRRRGARAEHEEGCRLEPGLFSIPLPFCGTVILQQFIYSNDTVFTG
jgi:hypothetical protein